MRKKTKYRDESIFEYKLMNAVEKVFRGFVKWVIIAVIISVTFKIIN